MYWRRIKNDKIKKFTRKSLEKLGIEYKPDTVYSNKKVDTNKKIAGVELIQDISSIKLGIENQWLF